MPAACSKYLQLDTTHVLFRYVKECNPSGNGNSNGGYFKGRVNLPFDKKRPLLMTLDLVATDDVVRKIRKDYDSLSEEATLAHPAILHNFRFDQENKKRKRDLEPEPSNHSWKLEYHIDKEGDIRIINKTSNLDANRTNVPTNFMTNKKAKVGSIKRDSNGYFFNFEDRKGKEQENEIIIKPFKPKLEGKDDEPTIRDIFGDRLRSETQKVRNILESFYTKKNARNIKMFRLRVRFYDWNTKELIGTGTSDDDIKDTGDQKTGAMDIFDVNNVVSCCSGGRKTTITSMWKLADKEVKPIFQVYNEHEKPVQEETDLLKQPNEKDIMVRHEAVIFISPKQDPRKIKYIQTEKGHKIKLLLLRDDGYESSKFDFKYIQHIPDSPCAFCELKVDGEYPAKLPKQEEPAKPNHIKRHMTVDKNKKNPKKPKMCGLPDTSGDDSNDSGNHSPPPYDHLRSQVLLRSYMTPLVHSSSEGQFSLTTLNTQIVHNDLRNTNLMKRTWNLTKQKSKPEFVSETGLHELAPMLENDPEFNLYRKSVIKKTNDILTTGEDFDDLLRYFPDKTIDRDGVRTSVQVHEESVGDQEPSEAPETLDPLQDPDTEENIVQTSEFTLPVFHLLMMMLLLLVMMVVSPIGSLVDEYKPRDNEFAWTGYGMNGSMIDDDIERHWTGPGGCDLEAEWSLKFTENLPMHRISTVLATVLILLFWKIGSGSSLRHDEKAEAEA